MMVSAPGVGSIVAGKYKLERVLGQGGMGVVYAAYHQQLDQRVAIKFLLPQVAAQHAGAVARFVREARACAKLRSEHVARVIDVGSFEDGSPYIVMEHLVGTDLSQLIKSFGALAIDDACDYVLQACEALAEAHSMGIVHRDLKPSNLFVARHPDGTPSVKLLDFGIAKAPSAEAWSEGALTGTDGAIGSPMYMSPEHLRNTATVDHRTDIWSLGIILHEILTGRHPFDATSPGGMCVMIAADPPAPLRRHRPDAPEELEAILLKCLHKDREQRFVNVGELAVALSKFSHNRSELLVDRILRVTASAVATRPSGPIPAIALPAVIRQEPESTASPGAATQPSGNFVVHQTSSPPTAGEPPPASVRRRRAWPLLVPVSLIALATAVLLLRRSPPLPPAPAAQPPPVESVVVPWPPVVVSPPVESAAPPVTSAAIAPTKPSVAPTSFAKSPSKPTAVPPAPPKEGAVPTGMGGAPSDPTETRK